MIYQWNWTAFFTAGNRPAFTIRPQDEHYGLIMQKLSVLSFEQSLRIIVSSVSQFDKKTWFELCVILEDLTVQSDHIHACLVVGQMVLDLQFDVENILCQQDMDRIVKRMIKLLIAQDSMGRFALLACLHNKSKHDIKAQMVFDYLLQRYDFATLKIQQMRTFFLQLTSRQREIAVLAGSGKTNKEISTELMISPASVAEHLTPIYSNLLNELDITTDAHGARYRLIHYLTRLFEQHPDLLIEHASR